MDTIAFFWDPDEERKKIKLREASRIRENDRLYVLARVTQKSESTGENYDNFVIAYNYHGNVLTDWNWDEKENVPVATEIFDMVSVSKDELDNLMTLILLKYEKLIPEDRKWVAKELEKNRYILCTEFGGRFSVRTWWDTVYLTLPTRTIPSKYIKLNLNGEKYYRDEIAVAEFCPAWLKLRYPWGYTVHETGPWLAPEALHVCVKVPVEVLFKYLEYLVEELGL